MKKLTLLLVLLSGAVLEGMMHDNPYIANDPVPAFDEVAVQFLVKVQPKNGAPASYIQKTFRLNYTIQYKY